MTVHAAPNRAFIARIAVARRWGASRIALFALLAAAALCPVRTLAQSTESSPLALKTRWSVQSSAKINSAGAVISRPGFGAQDWYSTTVPNTVVSALVDNHVYPDPNFGMNLRQYPGMGYKIGANFSNEEMPKDSPFRVSWWYRTEFLAPADWQGKNVWLNFRGINYRANIWLNGQQIAKSQDVAGAFRRYEFEVGRVIAAGQPNALAIEVFPPTPHDLAVTFVDWNPLPPDKDMGIWGDVFLVASGPVAVRNAQVETKFDLPSLDVAHLSVRAQVHNASSGAVQGVLRGTIEDIQFSQPVSLAANESKEITFAPDQFSQLNLAAPRIWWPYQMGAQDRYDLHLEFDIGDQPSDRVAMRFGIDQITSRLTPQGHLQISVNGKDVLIRGGGWSPDMFLHQDPQRWEDDFRYVRGMNLNTVRLEGKLMGDAFFDLADRYGILVMAGWCCCDHWEKWGKWKSDERTIATASLRDQVLRLRNHPSVFAWLNGSDNPPPAEIEKAYLKVLKEAHWPKPIVSSASEKKTSVTGEPGVKMTGPYDYVPPDYWLDDTEHGGAFGFNTETSPGPAIPPIDSLKKMIPDNKLWPPNEFWDFHAGGEQFKDVRLYNDALVERYGPVKNLADYEWKSQASAYEAERAMFEAFGRNRGTATGVIQWMLNNAWPSMIWHLYDFYLRPGGGYFGTKIACEPLHVQYSYDDHSVDVVNNELQSHPGLKVTAKVYDINAKEMYSHDESLDAEAGSVARLFKIPDVPGLSTTYFLKLTLRDSTNATLSSNFYWLSTKPDVIAEEGYAWYYTPEKAYADLHSLARLAPVNLVYSLEVENGREEDTAKIHISNPGDHLAFLVHLRLTRGTGGEELLPILWDDNYFALLPGESRDVQATYRKSDSGTATPVLEVSGWN
ncbi:MAG: sugar-binding domain-containing protein, partial [Candidatus Acidiferrales bacterium]